MRKGRGRSPLWRSLSSQAQKGSHVSTRNEVALCKKEEPHQNPNLATPLSYILL